MALYTRLTPNSNNWEAPSGREGKCSGKSSSLFEYRAGFGFEEWYRSPDFRHVDKNGVLWQYGYWQCFKNPRGRNSRPGLYKDFTVYTRICDFNNAKKLFANRVVAKYIELEVLNKEERKLSKILFETSLKNIRAKLLDMKLDVGAFDFHEVQFPLLNIRFKVSNEDYQFENKQELNVKLRGNRFGLYER